MIQTAHSTLRRIPTPMAGLALGIASVMSCWENVAPLGGLAQLTGAVVGGALLLVLAVKFLLHPDLLRKDLSHPVVGSVVPTFAMGSMVVAAAIGLFSPLAGAVLWSAAVILHLLFLAAFVFYRTRDFALHHMVPSWFVPPIGIIVAAVTVPDYPVLLTIARHLQNFGMLCYAIMLPLMLYRFIFSHAIPDAAKPTIAVMAAPASLSLAGYLTVSSTPSPLLVALLLGIALLMTLLIYLSFFHLLRLPFSPGYAAFTFPMAIGATALFKLAHRLQDSGFGPETVSQIQLLAYGELLVASAIIAYVAFRYLLNALSGDTAGSEPALQSSR